MNVIIQERHYGTYGSSAQENHDMVAVCRFPKVYVFDQNSGGDEEVEEGAFSAENGMVQVVEYIPVDTLTQVGS